MASNWSNVVAMNLCHLSAGGLVDGSADLFLNGNHQIPIHLDLSFALLPGTSGPSPEQVLANLEWIRNDNKSSLLYLSQAPQNQYCVYYQTSASKSKIITKDTPQYVFDFSFAATNSANAGAAESLSLRITNGDNPNIIYDASGPITDATFSNKTHIDFTFIHQKQYGDGTDLSYTPILVQDAGSAQTSVENIASGDWHDANTVLQYITIDDGLFYIHDFSNPAELPFDGLHYIHMEPENARTNHWWNAFIDTSAPVNEPTPATRQLRRNIVWKYADGSESCLGPLWSIAFIAEPHRIYSLSSSVYLEHTRDDYSYFAPTFDLPIHDQYGNLAIVTVIGDPWIKITSVTQG
ncbi:protein of unknown function [Pararobbsia alpina]|uniref:hypothetical protein n=1 Tax=Pararobbsia alpina TaxID=621374 RepID=UPI0039A7045D